MKKADVKKKKKRKGEKNQAQSLSNTNYLAANQLEKGTELRHF